MILGAPKARHADRICASDPSFSSAETADLKALLTKDLEGAQRPIDQSIITGAANDSDMIVVNLAGDKDDELRIRFQLDHAQGGHAYDPL